jgi:integrase/recombinase XerD
LQELNSDDLQHYLLHLLNQQRSHTNVNQVISAMKIFFHVCGRNDIYYTIPRPKKTKLLPDVLSTTEVLSILNATTNLKHKTMLFVAYSSGLRVGEVVRLRLTDLDHERMVIRVKQGKGRKDRNTLLSQFASDLIQDYLKTENPHNWLFPGDDQLVILRKEPCRKCLKRHIP